MSGIQLGTYTHGTPKAYAFAGTSVAQSTDTAINCHGFGKLMVYYYPGGAGNWDRAGTITLYGALRQNDTFVPMDATVENASFGVLHTDDAGEIYVIENIPNFVKLDWNCTTAGTVGTATVVVMAFNS